METVAKQNQLRHYEAAFKTEEEAMKELDMSKRICLQEACVSSGYQYYEISIRKENGHWGKIVSLKLKSVFLME